MENTSEPLNNSQPFELPPVIRKVYLCYSILLLILGCFGNLLLLATLFYKQIYRNSAQNLQQSRRSYSVPTENLTVGDGAKNVIAGGCAYDVSVRRRTIRHYAGFASTADYLLMLLTFCEFFCVWIVVFRYTLHLASGFDIRNSFVHGCVIHKFFTLIATNTSVALLCVFSAHRAMSMRWPMAIKNYITRFRLNCCLFCILVILLLKHTPVFFLYQHTAEVHLTKCQPRPNNLTILLSQVHRYVEFVTHSVIGYALLLVINASLYITLRKHRRPDENLQVRLSGKQNTRLSCHRERHRVQRYGLSASKIILCLSVTQFVSTTPYFIFIELFRILKVAWPASHHYLTLYYACVFVVFTNYVVNYFVVLMISSKFRMLTKEMILKIGRLMCCLFLKPAYNESRRRSSSMSQRK